MSLEAFDAERHHVGLGSVKSNSSFFGFLIDGAYNKGFRRVMQSLFDGIKYGAAEALVNVPGVSSWTQRDFSGGAYQYTWDDRDQAMFAASHNFLPSQFSRTLRSVPPLREWMGGKRLTRTDRPLGLTSFGGYLYTAWKDKFVRWTLTDGTKTEDTWPGAPGVGDTHVAWLLRDQGAFFWARNETISRYDLENFSGATYSFAPPAAVPASAVVTGGNADGGRLVVAYDDVVWTIDLPDDRTTAPNTATDEFVRIGRLPGRWVDSRSYAGLTYILCNGADMRTQLVAFDGTTILPITDFPYNFVGESLEVYGGRVYVGGSGRDLQTDVPRYAELYEITGASERLVRTFAPERWGAGATQPSSIPGMAVHEGLLFLCVKGQGLVAYDLTTDSFYGGPEFQPADATAMATDLLSGRENLFAWCGTLAAHSGESGWYRPATSQESVTAWTSTLETSDFSPSFDRTKRWKDVRAMIRFPSSAATTMSYSTDGGSSWSTAATGTVETDGNIQVVVWSLAAADESRQIRFRFNVANSTTLTTVRELLGFTATFRMLDSDSVALGEREKRAWVFTVGGVDRIEGGDRQDVVQDLEAMRDQLWSWARSREHLNFLDVDGGLATVEIDQLDEFQPDVLPPIDYRELGSEDVASRGREAFYKLTLVEV